jgi:membrane-bound metal-dependent hydrolase YbcI (DUF457 family)
MNKREHILNGILLGIGLGYILEPAGDATTFVKMAEVTPPLVLGAMFPDIDTEFGNHRKTLHNLPVLIFFYGYALVFGNLSWVWLGIVSHYILDIAGSTRGISWFYPLWDEEFGLPVGVPTSSGWAQWITTLITVGELAVLFAIVWFNLPIANLGDTSTLLEEMVRLASSTGLV